jgi:hypothetical protein
MPGDRARAKTPEPQGRVSGKTRDRKGSGKSADDAIEVHEDNAFKAQHVVVIFALFAALCMLWRFFVVMHVLAVLIGIVGMVFVAMDTPEMSTECAVVYSSVIVAASVMTAWWPTIDCGYCRDGRNTTEWKAVRDTLVTCARCLSATQQMHGPKSEVMLTADAKPRKVKCFDDVRKTWDPCRVKEYVDLVLTCKKD